MVILIHNDFAHRLLNNSTVESTDVIGGRIDEDNWGKLNHLDMGLTGGQMMYIRRFLQESNSALPLKPLPKKEYARKPVLNPVAPVGA